MEPFVVLGKWYLPEHMVHRTTRNKSSEGPLDAGGLWEHRPPLDNEEVVAFEDAAMEWHRDNDGLYGEPAVLVLWSNIYPTQVLLPNNKVVSGENNDVVMIDNRATYHRVPPGYVKALKRRFRATPKRHFLRLGAKEYSTEEQIEQVREYLRAN